MKYILKIVGGGIFMHWALGAYLMWDYAWLTEFATLSSLDRLSQLFLIVIAIMVSFLVNVVLDSELEDKLKGM